MQGDEAVCEIDLRLAEPLDHLDGTVHVDNCDALAHTYNDLAVGLRAHRI